MSSTKACHAILCAILTVTSYAIETSAHQTWPANKCAFECFNDGLCNSLGICTCEPGWVGVDCQFPALNGTSPEYRPNITRVYSYFDRNYDFMNFGGPAPYQSNTGALRLTGNKGMWNSNPFTAKNFVISVTLRMTDDVNGTGFALIYGPQNSYVPGNMYSIDWATFIGFIIRFSRECNGISLIYRSSANPAKPPCSEYMFSRNLSACKFAEFQQTFRIQVIFRLEYIVSVEICTVNGCQSPFVNDITTTSFRHTLLDIPFCHHGVGAGFGSALEIFEYRVRETVEYVADLSYLYGDFRSNWRIYRNANLTDPPGGIRLVTGSFPGTGSMWTVLPIKALVFRFVTVIEVNNDLLGNSGRGFGVFLATNASIAPANMFGINTTSFQGIATFVVPFSSKSCIVASSSTISPNTLCSGANIGSLTDATFNLRNRLKFTITMSTSTANISFIKLDLRNGPTTSRAINNVSLTFNIGTLAPLYLGIGGYSDSTNKDSIDVLEAKFHVPDDNNWGWICKNGGFMYAVNAWSPGTCNCQSGWTGIDCTQPICTPACQAKSRCVAPNACVCIKGYGNWPACDIPKCRYDCPLHAECVAPNTCKCISGWSGWRCSIPSKSFRTRDYGVTLIPSFSITDVTQIDSTSWTVWQPSNLDTSLGGIQANGALRLVPSLPSNRGALWNNKLATESEFVITGTVEIGRLGIPGDGFAIGFVGFSRVPLSTTYTAGREYMVSWAAFNGLMFSFQPGRSSSGQLCISMSAIPAAIDYKTNQCTALDKSKMRRKFEFILRIMSSSTSTRASADVCNADGCLYNVATLISSPGISLSGMRFGIFAENNPTLYDSFDIYELKSYSMAMCNCCADADYAFSSCPTCICEEGWGGVDCHSPLCRNAPATNSVCTSPYTWSCSNGWTGPDCSAPICSNVPKNGVCTAPNTVTCIAGYIGTSCSANFTSPYTSAISVTAQMFSGLSTDLGRYSYYPAVGSISYISGQVSVRVASSTGIPGCLMVANVSTPLVSNVDFLLNATIEAKKVFVEGSYYGILIMNRDGINRQATGNDSAMNWPSFSGLGVFFFPKTGRVCVMYVTGPMLADTNKCHLVSPSTVNLEQKVRIGIVTNGNKISVDVCTVSGCRMMFSNAVYTLQGDIRTVPNKFAAIAAWVPPNYYEDIDVYELIVSTLTTYTCTACNNGYCIGTNICLCSRGWTGSGCNTPATINTQNCSVCDLYGGSCTSPDTCTCNTGWCGSDCSIPTFSCYCQNGGTCTGVGQCLCPSGWTDANCTTPICSSPCLNGGNCTGPNVCCCYNGWANTTCQTPYCPDGCGHGYCSSPYNCTCNVGWTGSNCSSAACNETCANNGTCIGPNICSCSPLWTGATCFHPVCEPSCLHGNCTAPNNCSCLAGWTGQACDSAICSANCLNGGYCTSPDYCTCVFGFNGPYCESAVTATITSINTIMAMTDTMITDDLVTVGNVVIEIASGIADYITVPGVVELFSGIESLLDRLARNRDIAPDDFVYITQAFSTAADTVMQSATNGSESLLALDTDEEGSMKCQIDSDSTVSLITQPSKPTLTKDQLRGVFDSFMTMLVTMFSGLKTILRPGTNMSFNGKFYGATVFNLRLTDLPSFKVKTNLASVEFESVDNPFDLLGPIPAACSQLQANDIVHLVLSAFIVNTYDSDRPFNMPTVAIRLYCDEKHTIPNNPARTIKVSAIPSVKKADLFSIQKKDAQCDISKLKCDLTDNVDRISSLANFDVISQAGDFVLIFPVIEFPYFAYIVIGGVPSQKTFHWLATVAKTTVSLRANCSFTSPRHFYNTAADLRIIIPQSAVNQFQTTQPNRKIDQKLSISVLIKRDFSAYPSLDDLPPSACDLQRCYGYQLAIGLAKGQTELTTPRRKRSVVDEPSTEGFELDPSSSESVVVFKSKYFGDFGAELVIQPNTIEFSNIFANFTQLVAENSAVLAFQVAAIVFFIIGVLVLFKFDRDDLKEWAFLPITSNQSFHSVEYLVSIHSSDLKNSELGLNLSLRMIGKGRDTCWRLMEDGIRKNNFKSKRPANFILKTQLSLGIIDAVELKLESKSALADGKEMRLHIDRIVIVDVQQGLRYIFLAKSKLHQWQEIRVELATEDEIKGYTYLVTGHSRASLTEIHPWLSIAQRPLPSNWTRCERLGCVVSALFMAMLVNAMFYGKEATSPSVGVKVGPWFRISWFTVWTSFVGCLIVIPPTAVIAFIFKKVKRRSAEKSEWKTVLNLNVEQKCDAEKLHLVVDEKLQTQKQPFFLPFKCVIVAWILVAVCITVSAALVVLFSLEWGQSKSLQWLSGMMISVIQDIIVIQPIKVLLSSFVDATIHNLPNDGLGLGMLIYHQKTDKNKIKLFYRLRGVIIGIAHHLIYVLIFACVIGVMTNTHAYVQVVSLRAITIVPGIDQSTGTIGDHSGVFDWLQRILLPNLKWNNLDRNGVLRKSNHLYSVLNPNVALLGPIRLRQQRVNQMKCGISLPLGRKLSKNSDRVLTFNESCQAGYSDALGIGSSTEKRAFHGNWSLPLDGFYAADLYNISCYDAPWIYRESDEGIPYAGFESVHKTGGYYVDLPKNFDDAESLLGQLRQNRWLDNATSVLFVDFNLFNAQTNLFIPIKVVFESLSAGGMSYHARLFPLQLYQYSGASSTLVFVVQAMWLILLISQFVKLVIMFKKEGCSKFVRNGWNILDTFQVMLGFGVTGLFAARIYAVIEAVTKIQTLRSSFVSLDQLANWEDLIFCLLGIQFFLTMIVFFRHLSVNKHWAVLLGTLSNGKGGLIVYGLAFSYATILFAAIGYLIMGFSSQNFKSFTMAMFTLFQGLIGTVDFASVKYSPFYLFLMMTYNAVVIFFGGNLFITIILSSHRDVLVDIEKRTEWDAELAAFMGESIRSIIRKIVERLSKNPSIEFRDSQSSEKKNLNKSLERLANYLDSSEKNFRNDVAWSLELKSYLANERGENYGVRRKRAKEHLEHGAYVDGFPSIRSKKTQLVHNTNTLNKQAEEIVANCFKN